MDMNKDSWLSILFYNIGKQFTNDMQVQYSYIKGKDKIFLKRQHVLDVIGKNYNFCHRTLLKNEIIIDLDPNCDDDTLQFKMIYKRIHISLINMGYPHIIYFTGSRGLHVNIYDKEMFLMNKNERINHRHKICSMFLSNYDHLVCNENHMIAMEYCPHWKTGNLKTELIKWGVEYGE